MRHSFIEETPYYVATGGRVTFTQRLFRNIDGQVTIGFDRIAYEARLDEPETLGDQTRSCPAGRRRRRHPPQRRRAARHQLRPHRAVFGGAVARVLTRPAVCNPELRILTCCSSPRFSPCSRSAVRRLAAPAEYVAGPQDVLNIVVFGEEDLKKTVALDADGTFDFPYVGRIKAGGLTARAIGEEIAGKLKKFYVNPQVSVEVAKFRSQNVFVFGQVHAPGQYPLSGNMSVLQALAAAGSPTAAAASVRRDLAPGRIRAARCRGQSRAAGRRCASP